MLLFIGASLSWLLVLVNRRISRVFGGGVVCAVVAGGPWKSQDSSRGDGVASKAGKQRGNELGSIY